MVVLESCPKHNMVAYLEKTNGNTEFPEIVSFLTRSSIHHALTGKHFSGNVTPLFDSMLVQPTKDEGDTLERQSEPQPIPSPPHPSMDQHETQQTLSQPTPTVSYSDSILRVSVGIMEAQIKKLKKKAKPVITYHKAWMKSVSMKQRLTGKKSLKKQWMKMESVSKQRRKSAKAEPTFHKDLVFDELDDDAIDYMETEDAQEMGRTRYVVHEEKESAEKEVSTEDALSTAQPKVSTDKEEVSTDKPDKGTDEQKVSTDKEEVSTNRQDEGTVDQNEGRSATQTAPTTTTPTIFGDDETIAQVLIIMSQNKEKLKEKEKGVELKDVEESERPRPTSTRSLITLKHLPKIDPKDNGKKKIEEEDEFNTESEGITEVEKKFKQLARDEEVARKVLSELNSSEISLEPNDELFEHVGGKKHSDLKTKSFEEIKALYDKIKRYDDSFIAIGSAKDEKVINEMNEQVADASMKRVKKDDSIKGEIKKEEGTRKRKLGIKEEDEI
ncbi:hypothetical protein Tco_0868554 [Tanacetum coccineum]